MKSLFKTEIESVKMKNLRKQKDEDDEEEQQEQRFDRWEMKPSSHKLESLD